RRYDEMVDTAKALVAETRKLLLETEPQRQPVVEAYLFEQQRQLGVLFALAGRYDESAAYLRQLIEQVDELRREGESIAQKKDLEPAQRFQVVRQIQQVRQRQVLILRALAFVHQRRGDMGQAEAAGRDAYRLIPDNVGLNNDLGYMLADAGKDLQEADRMIRLAAGEDPDETAYLDSLGWVLYKQGRLEEARKWLLRAAASDEEQNPVIHDHIGDVLWRLGEHEEAARQWRQSMELHERKAQAGEGIEDDRHAGRTREKLAAVESGKSPQVAPIVTATQTAPHGG
ncbi:MAG TPA: tetratricopeptide repeat protein, partial [Phycisphaerae bacterium]|nr:tetratricopeptide repeat protein [Phycisphaerae bacterium]